MARFNAAFMSGSVDEKFQNRYNYLLDLLDTGYIVEKMIGNSMARIEVSPSVGIKISYGTTDMLSIDPTTGDLRVSGDIYVERLRASGSDDYMGFVKYGWGDTAVNFVTGDNDLPVHNMTEYLSITGDADTFTSSMLTILDSTPRFATTEVKRNFATTLRVGVNQSLSAMDEENTAYLTVNGNAANPYISLTAVGATFATRSELKVEANNITFNGNKVWHSGNDGSGSTLDADLLDGKQASAFALSAHTHNYAPISYFDNTGSYQGLVGTNGYIRTPVNGIIPKVTGGSGSVGTSGWPFTSIYGNTIYENGTALSTKYAAKSHTHAYVPTASVAIGTCTLNSSTWVDVSFGKTLPSTRRVMLTPNTSTAGAIAPKIRNVTNTGFQATIGGSGFSGIACDFIAIG